MALVPEITVPVLKFEGRMQALELRPGDVLVIHSDQRLSPVARHHISEALAMRFPDHKAVILDRGLTLNIMRKADYEAIEPDVVVEKL